MKVVSWYASFCILNEADDQCSRTIVPRRHACVVPALQQALGLGEAPIYSEYFLAHGLLLSTHAK